MQQPVSAPTPPQSAFGTPGRRPWPPTKVNQEGVAEQVPPSENFRRPWPPTTASRPLSQTSSAPAYQQTPLTVTGRRPWPPTNPTNTYNPSQVAGLQSSVETEQSTQIIQESRTPPPFGTTSFQNEQLAQQPQDSQQSANQNQQQPSTSQVQQQQFSTPPDAQHQPLPSSPRRRAVSRPSNIGPPPPPSGGIRPRWN